MAKTVPAPAPVPGQNGSRPAAAAPPAASPFEYHVYGPRNLSSTSWRDLLRSSWRDPSYRRMVMACFIQGVYLLELDRQEGRGEHAAGGAGAGLAPQWWRPFKYRLAEALVDARDGSVYGAVLEWDRPAALSGGVVFRPAGAPAAVVALRGTLLTAATLRRDAEDDLRFLAWESLRGSVRFAGALAAARGAARRLGAGDVCVAGHSLGAGFALQVGKALAKEHVFVECHVFNPPSVSLAMSLRGLADAAGELWGRVRAWIPYVRGGGGGESEAKAAAAGMGRWVPHLYINTNDYICCYYNDAAAVTGEAAAAARGRVARMVVASKGPSNFLDAHGLQQWWANDVELQVALNHSKLINRQLRSLYAAPPPAAGS